MQPLILQVLIKFVCIRCVCVYYTNQCSVPCIYYIDVYSMHSSLQCTVYVCVLIYVVCIRCARMCMHVWVCLYMGGWVWPDIGW